MNSYSIAKVICVKWDSRHCFSSNESQSQSLMNLLSLSELFCLAEPIESARYTVADDLRQLDCLSSRLRKFPQFSCLSLTTSMTGFDLPAHDSLALIALFCLFPLHSFDMASTDHLAATPLGNGGDHSAQSTISASEPRRKVSILTDPPLHAGGIDNLAFDGPRRKISQVRKRFDKLKGNCSSVLSWKVKFWENLNL